MKVVSAIAAMTVLLFPRSTSPTLGQSSTITRLGALSRVVGRARPAPGRLVAFPYVETTGIGNADSEALASPEFLELARIARDIEAAAAARPTAETLHAASVLQLVWGKPSDAIAYLERIPRDGRSSEAQNDLAMAYSTRARAGESQQDYFRALEAIESALELDLSLEPAVFNRAWILEQVSLFPQSLQAWRDYLSCDDSSAWAAEGAEAIRRLSQYPAARSLEEAGRDSEAAFLRSNATESRALARAYPESVRKHVEDETLGEWADAVFERKPHEAARYLAYARVIGNELDVDGHRLLSSAIGRIDSGSGEKARLLVDGHRSYRNARRLYQSFEIEEAEIHFGQSYEALDRAGSPFSLMAFYYWILCRYQAGDFPAVLESAEAMARRNEVLIFPVLRARADYLKGLTLLAAGDAGEALQALHSAFDTFVQSREPEMATATSTLLAQCYEFLGDPATAWKHRFEALRQANAMVVPPLRRSVVRSETADALWREGLSRAALVLEEAAFADLWTMTRRIPVSLTRTLRRKALILARMRRFDDAYRALQQAESYADEVGDARIAEQVLATLDITRAQLLIESKPDEAVAALRATVAMYQKRGVGFVLPELRLQLARAHRKTGDLAAAARELETGAGELEGQRTRISSPSLRSSFDDAAKRLLKEATDTEASRSNVGSAWAYAERKRARNLLDLFTRQRNASGTMADHGGAVAEPLSLEKVETRLPSDTALVQYEVFGDHVLSWVVTRDGTHQQVIALQEQTLSALIAEFRQLCEGSSGSPELASLGKELYERLIRPVRPWIDRAKVLVIVPDAVLNYLPFTALMDPASDRFLVQDFVIGYAPSATLYMYCSSRNASLRSVPERVAIFTPESDTARFPRLQPLTAARDDAGTIMSLHKTGEIYSGANATRGRFAAVAHQSTVIHFAGHTLVNPQLPWMSRLVFSKDGLNSGDLYAHEVLGVRFNGTRVVVLASCNSASGALTGDGVSGLAQAFLGAGVPNVVGTLWNIEDRTTSDMVVRFHRALASGKDAWRALRDAQVSVITSEKGFHSPSSWAGFVVIGGTEEGESHDQ